MGVFAHGDCEPFLPTARPDQEFSGGTGVTTITSPQKSASRAPAELAGYGYLLSAIAGATILGQIIGRMFLDPFEEVVSQYYEPLYKFAFSLTGTVADASDLTQETFYIWATKGHQLRDRAKVKSWLFTTLHREFLNKRKRAVRFPDVELIDGDDELPVFSPEMANKLDATRVVELLGQVAEPYRAAVSLFYLEDCSYKEIAALLEIPVGTVRSRISRGMAQLQQFIMDIPTPQEHHHTNIQG